MAAVSLCDAPKVKPVGSHHVWHARKTWSNVKGVATPAPDLPTHVTNRVYGRRDSRPQVIMAKNEPRPTWKFHFEWKTLPKSMRITLV